MAKEKQFISGFVGGCNFAQHIRHVYHMVSVALEGLADP